MLALLRKIWFTLIGKSNDVYEKTSQPEVVLRQAAREMAEQRKSLRRVWVDLETQKNLASGQMKERENVFNTTRAQAKKAKEEGDLTQAQLLAERCLKIKSHLDGLEAQMRGNIERMTEIESEIEKLEFEESNLKMEASMASSTMALSKFDTEASAGEGSHAEHVNEMVESARNRLKTIENSASANRAAARKFDNVDAPVASADAQSFLDSL